MNSERWRQVDKLFQSAMDLEVGDRPAFLEKACAGDETLRHEVESLLAAHEGNNDFLATPVLEAAAKLIAADQGPQAPLDAGDASQTETIRLNPSGNPQVGGHIAFLEPQVTLDGRYLIERELGRGGIGAVFLARDQKLHGAPVVIKVLLERLQHSEDRAWFERKFRDEIKALSQIDHPGVVRALDVGSLPDGRSYLVMQYVSGVSLRYVMPLQGMELKRAGKLIHQIAQALTAAHEQGVIHRDLKPENIMLQVVGDEEYVKLIDFGIATVRETVAAATAKMTKVAGTVDYMAPEQLRGQPIPAGDIYALGVIAYEIITGQRPFNPDTAYQLVELQRAGVRVKPRDLRSDLPEAAEEVILKALSFEPSDRYPRARDFSEALNQAITQDVAKEVKPGKRIEVRLDHFNSDMVEPAPASKEAIRAKAPPNRSNKHVRLLLALAGLMFVAAIGALTWWNSSLMKSEMSAVNKPVAERSLNYWMLVKKNPRNHRGQQPFVTLGDIQFEAGDQVRLLVSSPQAGYLYVINEGPARSNSQAEFNVMFPDALTNGGSAEIAAGQSIQIPRPNGMPDQDWFYFDNEAGVEKIWLVWSEQRVSELEAVKGWANPQNKGVIGNPAQIKSIEQYLTAQPLARAERDEAAKQVKLRNESGLLIGLAKLEHR